MNILITGSSGFIGKNLVAQLKNTCQYTLYLCNRQTTPEQLQDYLHHCDFIVHLAGTNRPCDSSEFMKVHRDFTAELLGQLKQYGNPCPILAASSIQAASHNPYGESKKAMEEELIAYGKETGAPIIIYRLPNVFGKWCRPHYNSVIATFCHQISREGDIRLDDENRLLHLVHIDDVAEEFIRGIHSHPTMDYSGYGVIPIDFSVSLKEITEKLGQFHRFGSTLIMPSLIEPFDRKLYSTYLSYLPPHQFNQPLDMKLDERGFFSELMKSDSFGQISISRTKPGIIRGNHWHHTKTEKFIVVEGEALIRFRKTGETEVIEYRVSGQTLEIVEVPPGYTHSLKNCGETHMVALIWASELFDEEKPDTYFEEV